MRKLLLNLLIIFGAAVLSGQGGPLWAQTPPNPYFEATVVFDKDYFDLGEEIGATVTVANISNQDLLVNKGFLAKKFYLQLRLIDPAGRLLLPKTTQDSTEFPDAPALAVALCNGIPTQVAAYEVWPAGWSVTQHADLRDHYPIKFPGRYSAEVQLSVMIFKLERCPGDIKDYHFSGVVKSETTTAYTQGTNNEVDVIPKIWLLNWKDGLYLFPGIAVAIWPQEGKTVDDYRRDHIQLNNVEAKEVYELHSYLRKKDYLLAIFDKQEAINSLGQVEENMEYPVVISGMLTNNEFFGGGQKIKIIRIF